MPKKICFTLIALFGLLVFYQSVFSVLPNIYAKIDKKSGIPNYVAYSKAQIALGRHLFYDRRLSANGSKSCASCHSQALAFTDGYRRSLGLWGDTHKHNAQPLFNLPYNRSFTWSRSDITSLEQQIVMPLMGIHPVVEMGMNAENMPPLTQTLANDLVYKKLFEKAFPNQNNAITTQNIVASLAAFCQSIQSFNSDFDRNQLSQSALRGKQLFFGLKLQCFECHSGKNFNENPSATAAEDHFFNIGLYNIAPRSLYPKGDRGLLEHTHEIDDMGKFRTPTLRNLAFTAPYMHDGSVETLAEVIQIYEQGGRNIDLIGNPNTGDGRQSRYKVGFLTGFEVSKSERDDLINFLMALNDSSLTTNKKYSNPFEGK